MEEWIFGHQTQTALITYQAMEHLPETGVCDMESWERLLGPGYRHVTKDEMPPDVQEAAQEANARVSEHVLANQELPSEPFANTPPTKADLQLTGVLFSCVDMLTLFLARTAAILLTATLKTSFPS